MPNKPNTINYIEFPAAGADGIAAAKAFYGAAFGWSFKDWGETYIDTQDSGVASGFDGESAQGAQSPLVVIYAAGLEGAQAKIVAAGGVVTRDIFSFPGGRRFHFRDPAGNELAVWSDR